MLKNKIFLDKKQNDNVYKSKKALPLREGPKYQQMLSRWCDIMSTFI